MNTPHGRRGVQDDPGEGAQKAREAPVRERTAGPGETRWSQADGEGLQRPVPRQPNERDESASSQAADSPSMQGIGELAYRDAVEGADTDRGPVLDAVYNGAVTEGQRVGDEEAVRGKRDPMKSTSSKDR